jgi:CRISPR/Cas system-associated protein endoribonuclease Cas2
VPNLLFLLFSIFRFLVQSKYGGYLVSDLTLEEKLTKILKAIQVLNERIDLVLPRKDRVRLLPEVQELSEVELKLLLGLDSHLQKTALTVIQYGTVNAEQAAKLNHKARAVESNYLNQLEDRGFLSSLRKGRVKFFWWNPNMQAEK